MDLILILPLLVSFFTVLFILPSWIKKARYLGLIGKDMNKYSKNEVAEVGGIAVIAGFSLGLMIYVAIKTFYLKSLEGTGEIFVVLSTVLLLAFIGLIDSLLASASKSSTYKTPGWRIGIRKRYRLLLCLFAAIPLMVINAGSSIINLPFIGAVDIGLLYPLLLVPLAIIGTSTTFNFLAGFNGLEAGLGILVLSFLSFVAYATGSAWLALIGLIMVVSLIGFLIFNWYPAKVFPSDVLTYPVGGMIAIMAILGNFEKIALFVFIPFIIEVILKSRGGLKKQSFAIPQKDGSLKMPYEKVYGLTHFSIWFLSKFKKKVYERDVVYLIFAVQIVFILIGFLML